MSLLWEACCSIISMLCRLYQALVFRFSGKCMWTHPSEDLRFKVIAVNKTVFSRYTVQHGLPSLTRTKRRAEQVVSGVFNTTRSSQVLREEPPLLPPSSLPSPPLREARPTLNSGDVTTADAGAAHPSNPQCIPAYTPLHTHNFVFLSLLGPSIDTMHSLTSP